MKLRDIFIAFGYEIDKGAERKVNDSIDGLKSFASDALSENTVGFEVDEESRRQVESSIEDLEATAEPLGETPVAYEVDRASEQEAINSIHRIRSTALRLLGVIGIGFSLIQMTRLSEAFGSVNDQIRDATRGMGDQHEIQQRIKRAANEARQDYAVMANTINRLAIADVFDNIEDASRFATLMAQDFAAAGKSQYESAYLTRNITMDLQKGVMSARTFTTALRDSPHLINRLANSLNVSTEQLQEMARRGEITADMLKDSFLGSADEIAERFAQTDMSISDAIRNVRNGWGLFLSEMDDALGVSRAVARGIVNSFNHVLFMLRRLTEMFMRLADRLGGLRNMFRLLKIVAGAFMAVMAVNKIMGIVRAIQMMDRAILKAKLKMLAIVAVVIALALLIEDFVAFMQGEESLLGHLLEKFGIDADGVRKVVLELWEVIRGVIPFVMELAKAFGGLLLEVLQIILPLLMNLVRQVLPLLLGLIQRLLPFFQDLLNRILPVIITLIESVVGILMEVLNMVLPVLIDLIESLLPLLMWIIDKILTVIIDLLDVLLPLILDLIGQILPIFIRLIETIIPLVMQIIQSILPVIIRLIETLLPMVVSIIERVLPILINLIQRLLPVVIQIIDTVLPVLIGLIETLLPIVMRIIDIVLPIITSLIEVLISTILPIIDTILPLLMGLLEALMPVIIFVAELLGTVLGAAFEGLVPIIDAVMKIFGGLIDFIVGVFTGDWSRAWEGVKNIFSGIVSGLAAIFKFPINLIITGLNFFIRGLNKIRIPNWVPGVGGKGINIPETPMLAKGSDFSPDTFIAGEEGPELITNAKGSKVFTAAETADTLGKLNALANMKPPEQTDQHSGNAQYGDVCLYIDWALKNRKK